MVISQTIFWIVYFYPVIGMVDYSRQLSQPNWLNDLVHFIDKDFSFYQIMLVIQNRLDLQEPIARNVVQALRHIPSQVFSFDDHSEEILSALMNVPAFRQPRPTTLFITIFPPEKDFFFMVKQLTDLSGKLAQVWSRPRCLVILLTEKKCSSYKELMRFAWSKQFSDFTILELSPNQKKKNHFVSNNIKYKENNCNDITDKNSPEPRLHIFYPFSDTYIITPFYSGVEWFPNKLQDLDGKLMKLGVITLLPYSNVTRDKSGNPTQTGTDFRIIKMLSSAMNFTIAMPPQQTEDIGNFNCDINKTTGLIWNLTHNQIRMIGVRLPVLTPCNGTFTNIMNMNEMRRFCAVVPILFSDSKSFLIRWEFFYYVVLIILLLTFIVGAIHFFRFRKSYWNVTQILSIVLGVSVPREPTRVKERIVFGCLIIASAVYSSNIFAAFAHKILQTKTEREFATLDDLYVSELKPIISPNLAYAVSRGNDGIVKKLVEKATKSNMSTEECVELMVRYRNISCIMGDAVANLMIEATKDKCGKPKIKTVDQRLWTFPTTFFLEPRSVYVDRFDRLMLMMTDTGLVDGWNKETSKSFLRNTDNAEYCDIQMDDSSDVHQAIFLVLCSGYLISIAAFVAEIVKNNL